MSIQLGLIGQKISQSKSPALQNLLGQIYNLDVDYQLVVPGSADEADFAKSLELIRQRGYVGTNVTYPYKQIALAYADSVDTAAERVGATNTLRFEAGEILATNTDYSGFIGAYKRRRGDQSAGDVLLIGAGGVGRAVAFALQEVGLETLKIFDLNIAGAKSLAGALKGYGIDAEVISADQLEVTSQQVDGLINCTPIGHRDSPGNPLKPSCFGNQSWAFDAVYVPLDTEFLQCAHSAGLEIISGFDLFLYQAVDAFTFFTGQAVDVAEARMRLLAVENIHSDLVKV